MLLPLTVAYVWRTRGRRDALVCLGIAIGVVVAVVLPFFVMSPHGVWTSFSRQLSRPLQIESIGAALIHWAAARAMGEWGAGWIRVDVWTTNTALHQYYKNQGFEHLRTLEFQDPWEYPSAALFQKPAAGAEAKSAGWFRAEEANLASR